MEYPKQYAEELASQYGHSLDDLGNVTSPGKFEGETWRTIDAYDTLQNGCEGESFGNSDHPLGFWFEAEVQTGDVVYCQITEQGFVEEYNRETFDNARAAYNEEAEREEATGNLRQSIREMEDNEHGSCDSCLVANINGTRCHEQGCPRWAELQAARKHLEDLENY